MKNQDAKLFLLGFKHGWHQGSPARRAFATMTMVSAVATAAILILAQAL